jgi:actin-related protein
MKFELQEQLHSSNLDIILDSSFDAVDIFNAIAEGKRGKYIPKFKDIEIQPLKSISLEDMYPLLKNISIVGMTELKGVEKELKSEVFKWTLYGRRVK